MNNNPQYKIIHYSNHDGIIIFNVYIIDKFYYYLEYRLNSMSEVLHVDNWDGFQVKFNPAFHLDEYKCRKLLETLCDEVVNKKYNWLAKIWFGIF